MDDLIISDVVEEDLRDILSLARKVSELNVFPTLSKSGQHALNASQEKDITDILDKKIYQARKVKLGNKLVAYIAWRNSCYLAQLYVDSEYQGKGIGALLIDEIAERAKEPYLKVRSSLNAVSFYEKYGFVPTGKETEINDIKFVPMEYKIDV